MCLAMHESMYDNSAVKKNIEFLKNKIQFLNPQMIEGKAKAPEPENVLELVLKKFGFSSILKNKKVLMTAGPTIEYIDPVRVITNLSSGKTGVLLASELVSAGAKVTIIYGPGNQKPPKGARIINVITNSNMFDATKKELKKKYDIVIMAAAASDFTPERVSKSKIKSNKKSLTIRLKKAPKIIDMVRKFQKDALLIGFKAETNITKSALIKSAQQKMKEASADIIIANDIGRKYQKNPSNNQVLIVDDKKTTSSGWKKKEKIVKFIKREIENKLE
jgi:phosphopantothenoylcysteine decarboxylase/phosphopantothenate--cysteine ligase